MEFPLQKDAIDGNNQTKSASEEETRPKDTQDNQESSPPQKQEKHSDPTTTLVITHSGSAPQDSDEVGVYGPWMLVKKVPRKKPQGKPISASNQQSSSQLNNIELGTIFSLLQNNEEQEDGHNQISSKLEEQTPTAGHSAITKIRDPKAGKNPQNSQDKKKTQNKSVQKGSSIKAKTGNPSHQTPKISSNVPTPIAIAGTKKVSDGSAGPITISKPIISQQDLDLKRQREQEILQVMRIKDKDRGSKGDMLKLQSEYMQALTSNCLNPKPPDKEIGA
ncbi:hypothetical protein SESBI_30284 [Sesbania bispinosa]|nr:hypothetical protein SESBI_30284 [Sesbania bispinosa]